MPSSPEIVPRQPAFTLSEYAAPGQSDERPADDRVDVTQPVHVDAAHIRRRRMLADPRSTAPASS